MSSHFHKNYNSVSFEFGFGFGIHLLLVAAGLKKYLKIGRISNSVGNAVNKSYPSPN